MSTNTLQLHPVTTRGWRMGLANMLGNEMGKWFRTKNWIVMSIIWILISDGLIASLLSQGSKQPGGLQSLQEAARVVFLVFGGVAPAVGVSIAMQDAIIGERQSGTAAWMLSKPLSRIGFVLSKLIASTVAFLVTAVVIPGIVSYVLFGFFPAGVYPVANFVLTLAVMMLHLLFYLTLTLMLGTLTHKRGAALGIPLGLLLGYQFVLGLVPKLIYVMPYWLVVPLQGPGQAAGEQTSVALSVLTGQPITSTVPVVMTVVWIIVFVVVALVKFQREEF